MEGIFFYILSFVCLVSALAVVFFKNPIYSALALITTMLGIAGHFALLQAHFLAVIQVAVYAGAIMVLVVFVIMLLNVHEAEQDKRNIFIWGGAFFLGLLALLSVIPSITDGLKLIEDRLARESNFIAPASEGYIQNLGQLLYKDYVFCFEFASILILAALVGAVLVGKKESDDNT